MTMKVLKNVAAVRTAWKWSGEFLRLMSLSGAVCLLDQLFKNAIDTEPEENFPREMPGTKGQVKIMRVHNPGFSRGRLGTYPEFVKLVSITLTGFLAGGLHALTVEHPGIFQLRKLGISFVIGGALSNILDRVRKGKVTDYLNINLPWFKKLVVNIADLSIYLGGILYVISAFLKRDE